MDGKCSTDWFMYGLNTFHHWQVHLWTKPSDITERSVSDQTREWSISLSHTDVRSVSGKLLHYLSINSRFCPPKLCLALSTPTKLGQYSLFAIFSMKSLFKTQTQYRSLWGKVFLQSRQCSYSLDYLVHIRTKGNDMSYKDFTLLHLRSRTEAQWKDVHKK